MTAVPLWSEQVRPTPGQPFAELGFKGLSAVISDVMLGRRRLCDLKRERAVCVGTQEDEMLRQLVAEYGPKKWSLIATKMKTKGSKQVWLILELHKTPTASRALCVAWGPCPARRRARHSWDGDACLNCVTAVPKKVEELPQRGPEEGRLDRGGAGRSASAGLHTRQSAPGSSPLPCPALVPCALGAAAGMCWWWALVGVGCNPPNEALSNLPGPAAHRVRPPTGGPCAAGGPPPAWQQVDGDCKDGRRPHRQCSQEQVCARAPSPPRRGPGCAAVRMTAWRRHVDACSAATCARSADATCVPWRAGPAWNGVRCSCFWLEPLPCSAARPCVWPLACCRCYQVGRHLQACRQAWRRAAPRAGRRSCAATWPLRKQRPLPPRWATPVAETVIVRSSFNPAQPTVFGSG